MRHPHLNIGSITKHQLLHSITVMGFSLFVSAFSITALAAEKPVWDANNILGSKHDLTSLNERAGVEAMGGVAFTDYGDACLYCHIPEEEQDQPLKPGQLPNWNRYKTNLDVYEQYTSGTLKSVATRPGEISLLCLSCHDGTMAVDRIAFRPTDILNKDDYSLHMKLSDTDNISSCGKCHDGTVAHEISRKVIGSDMTDDHPIAIRYLGLDNKSDKFFAPDDARGFDNGIRLYGGNIECATCHDVHTPDSYKLLRTDAETLCSTCHTN